MAKLRQGNREGLYDYNCKILFWTCINLTTSCRNMKSQIWIYHR